jgi:hypothetical protein
VDVVVDSPNGTFTVIGGFNYASLNMLFCL